MWHCNIDGSQWCSLLLAGWLYFFPESPKFLIECGETDEALEVLRHIYEKNTGNSPADYPVRSNHHSTT